MRIRVGAIAGLVWLLCTVTAAVGQGTLYTLRTNGPTANRVNLVFLAEGYTNGQTVKFTNDAKVVLQTMLSTPPYTEYAGYVNAFAIFVASVEAGSDHPSSSVFHNTYFNSSYDSYGISYLLTIPPNDHDGVYANGRGKVDALLQSLRPDYDIALLLVNDSAYGGSGGPVPVASLNSSSAQIAIHETSHSFANLGDEYTTPYPGYPDTEEPNTTRQTNRAQIKWNAWIAPSTPVPTPDTSAYTTVVGLFEGAHYHTTNWFRPKRDCKMRTLSAPFCEVCREAITTSIYDRLDPIDGVSPPTNALVSVTNAGPVTLSITRLEPATHQLAVQWFINNVPRTGATGPSLDLGAWDLPLATNIVRALVTDTTLFVRTDPQQLLQSSRSWRVRPGFVQPLLAIRQTNNLVSISWSQNAVGFLLQSKPNLDPATPWAPVMVIGSQTSAEFPLSSASSYFRLQSP